VSSLPDDRQRPKTTNLPARPDIAVEPLAPLPKKPTLVDLMVGRLNTPRHGMKFAVAPHVAQSAAQALKAGLDEETVLACLLHDIGMGVARPDHGWWGAQLIEPYVSERVSWAVRYHQALRFYPDASVGYEYPELYLSMFGRDYKPPEYIQAAYQYARNHSWYMTARHVTMYDDYSFDANLPLNLEPFIDIIGRNFRQPAQGLGNDTSPAAHMWRTIVDPSKPL
jgi:predicted HD phosphohydrolase